MIETDGQEAANAIADEVMADAAEPADQATALPADDAGEEPEPKRSRVQERIDELTRDKYTLLQDRDYWRQKALAEEKPKEPEPESPKEPQLEDFSDTEDYLKAHASWTRSYIGYERQRTIQEAREQAQREAENQRKQASQQQVQGQWAERMNEARTRLDGFDAIALNPNITVNETMADVIMDSDKGPDLLYHLGKYPEKAARIAAMPPSRAAAALGKLEAEVMSQKTPKSSNAPPPPKPERGSGEAPTKDPSKMSMTEFVKWRQSRK